MLDTELNMLILNIDIKEYVCYAQKMWRMRNKFHLTAFTQAVITWYPQIKAEEPAWNQVLWTVPCPWFGASPAFYLCRQVWAHATKQRMAVTATESCGHVGKKQHGFQWEEVTAKQCWAQDVVLRWSRPLGRQVLGPRVLDTSFVDHQQESCKGLTSWFRDAMIQGHLNNNFARKNFQGIESVTVPKEGSPGLSRLLSVLKHLTSSWEALGFLWLWVTL